jgi:hypothetical protein
MKEPVAIPARLFRETRGLYRWCSYVLYLPVISLLFAPYLSSGIKEKARSPERPSVDTSSI